ncbi:MAG: DUF308 domain-containing protein [Patescibacteria group bacterium]
MSKQDNDLWGGLAFRGMLAIVFGLAAVFWPGLTLVTLVYLFSGFLLASGLIGLVLGLVNIFNGKNSLLTRVLAVGLGAVEIGAGVYLLRHPEVAFSTFILIIGLLFIGRGVIDAFVGIFEDDAATTKTISTISGVLSVIVGVILLMQPASGGVAFVWILGLYALITGPMLLALSYDLKNAK